MNTFANIIPAPTKLEYTSESLKLENISTFYTAEPFTGFAPAVQELFKSFSFDITSTAPDSAALAIVHSAMPEEAFSIEISPDKAVIAAGSQAGVFYALECLRQMLFTATIASPKGAVLTCGKLEDAPRFTFRSFHLDSARHFQNIDVIKRMLRMMASCRLNTFHWHLVDSQGWRLQLKTTAGLENRYTKTPGYYTADDIKEVVEFAAKHHISVIPEIDFPGHSRGTLNYFPQYACCNAAENPGEICLGNPASKEFVKNILAEVMELFPQSKYIHIGGDEANTANWEKCPLCRKAMQENSCKDMRELENIFMRDIAQFVIDNNRHPIIWGTCSGQTYQPETTIQAWLDIREPLRVAPNGNKVIYSVHTSLYFDYPQNLSEPWETWMFELSERGVYMTDPYIIWADKVKDCIIGTEACLWTETVPQWRIIPKILPRLHAYSECAWSDPAKKDYQDFHRRKELLEAAGYMDHLINRKA
ncbi:MAG: hypothetical protein E7039_03640 [Lentisphaerae bacterium]|nr:hypothetical protein [Lentisphaerota bacterium]